MLKNQGPVQQSDPSTHKSILKKTNNQLKPQSNISWGNVSLKNIPITPDSITGINFRHILLDVTIWERVKKESNTLIMGIDEREEQKAKNLPGNNKEKIKLLKPKFSLFDIMQKEEIPKFFYPPNKIQNFQSGTQSQIGIKSTTPAVKDALSEIFCPKNQSVPTKLLEKNMTSGLMSAPILTPKTISPIKNNISEKLSEQKSDNLSIEKSENPQKKDVYNIQKSISENTRDYFRKRINNLIEITQKIFEKKTKIEQKQKSIDFYINGKVAKNNENYTLEFELAKLKNDICKSKSYLEMVNYYLFSSKKLGWKISTQFNYCEFPNIFFDLENFGISLKITLPCKFIGNTTMIMQNDNLIEKLGFIIRDLSKWPIKLQNMSNNCEFKQFLENCLEKIGIFLEKSYKLSNKLSTGNLRTILWEAVELLGNFNEFCGVLNKISKEFIRNDPIINTENFKIEYCVTVTNLTESIIICYTAISDLKNLNKIECANLKILNVLNIAENTSLDLNSDKIKNEIQSAIQEHIGTMKNENFNSHYEFAVFLKKYLSQYNN